MGEESWRPTKRDGGGWTERVLGIQILNSHITLLTHIYPLHRSPSMKWLNKYFFWLCDWLFHVLVGVNIISFWPCQGLSAIGSPEELAPKTLPVKPLEGSCSQSCQGPPQSSHPRQAHPLSLVLVHLVTQTKSRRLWVQLTWKPTSQPGFPSSPQLFRKMQSSQTLVDLGSLAPSGLELWKKFCQGFRVAWV